MHATNVLAHGRIWRASKHAPTAVIRSILRTHGPLTKTEIWTQGQSQGLKSKNHTGKLLQMLCHQHSLRTFRPTPESTHFVYKLIKDPHHTTPPSL